MLSTGQDIRRYYHKASRLSCASPVLLIVIITKYPDYPVQALYCLLLLSQSIQIILCKPCTAYCYCLKKATVHLTGSSNVHLVLNT